MPQLVLIIDDAPEIHALLAARLAPEGLAFRYCLDPARGLELARTLLPDLILLDVDMPGISGFELCAQLKQDALTAELPVIFLTGASDTMDKVKGFDLGAVDYVTKPFEPAELRARVRAALRTKRYQDLLAEKAHLDALTGLYSRAYFERRLADEVAAARRYGRVITLVLLDLDHFRSVNEVYGHPFGDRVLQAVGEMLSGNVRAVDAPCRYGGQKFAVLVPEASVDNGAVIAMRLQTRLTELPLAHQGRRVAVTGSFGVSSTARLGSLVIAADCLVAAADRALRASKRAGRDLISCAA